MAELHPWMDWATDVYTEAATQSWFDHVQLAWGHFTSFQFSIIECASGDVIGGCTVDGIDKQKTCCNIGYWVCTNRTGCGFGSRSIRLAAKFAFQTIGLARAEIVIAAKNTASQRTAQKAGAHYQGRLPKPIFVRMDEYDAVLYSLNPADIELTA